VEAFPFVFQILCTSEDLYLPLLLLPVVRKRVGARRWARVVNRSAPRRHQADAAFAEVVLHRIADSHTRKPAIGEKLFFDPKALFDQAVREGSRKLGADFAGLMKSAAVAGVVTSRSEIVVIVKRDDDRDAFRNRFIHERPVPCLATKVMKMNHIAPFKKTTRESRPDRGQGG
jgi:hypothetical protein